MEHLKGAVQPVPSIYPEQFRISAIQALERAKASPRNPDTADLWLATETHTMAVSILYAYVIFRGGTYEMSPALAGIIHSTAGPVGSEPSGHTAPARQDGDSMKSEN